LKCQITLPEEGCCRQVGDQWGRACAPAPLASSTTSAGEYLRRLWGSRSQALRRPKTMIRFTADKDVDRQNRSLLSSVR
jgi:hypothetical protein